ncbi:MAG: hypothetical protein PHD76_04385 [Methylacidiphilales bacterium]|nr:hypothetical protein [Candidatus Methylacidiphilales bacterium]
MLQGLTEIRLRKARLVQDSELQRAGLVAEVEYLNKQLGWVQTGRALASRMGPALLVLIPLGGLFAVTGLGKKIHLGGLADKAVGLWRIVNKAQSYYRGFQAARGMIMARLQQARSDGV